MGKTVRATAEPELIRWVREDAGLSLEDAAKKTGIEWTDSTWNPVTGCTRVSSGCDKCYAATLAGRLLRDVYLARLPVVDTDITRRDPFAVRLWPERLCQPLEWRDARMIFVNSMSDAFQADVPDEFIRSMFLTMLEASWHTYQVLTKRPARALLFWRENKDLFNGGPLPQHIWIGTNAEIRTCPSSSSNGGERTPKAGGRELDGQHWDGMPGLAAGEAG